MTAIASLEMSIKLIINNAPSDTKRLSLIKNLNFRFEPEVMCQKKGNARGKRPRGPLVMKAPAMIIPANARVKYCFLLMP